LDLVVAETAEEGCVGLEAVAVSYVGDWAGGWDDVPLLGDNVGVCR
jgi:hypothetical protein